MERKGMSRRLTIKQAQFVKKYVETNGNGVQSALEVYDTSNPEVANAIASENLQKPLVQDELQAVLAAAGLTTEEIARQVKQIAVREPEKPLTYAEKLRGLEMAAKMLKMYPPKTSIKTSYSVSERLVSKNFSELKTDLASSQQEAGMLLADLDD